MKMPNNNETIPEKSEEYLEYTLSVRDSKLSKNSDPYSKEVKNEDGIEEKSEVYLNNFNSKNLGHNKLLINSYNQNEKNETINKSKIRQFSREETTDQKFNSDMANGDVTTLNKVYESFDKKVKTFG